MREKQECDAAKGFRSLSELVPQEKMSDTPETDAAVKESNGQWSFVLKETCQRLERERNKAREDATNFYAKIGELIDERRKKEAKK